MTRVRRIRTLPKWITELDLCKIEKPIRPGCGLAFYEDGRPTKRFTAPKGAVALKKDHDGWYWLLKVQP